MEDPFQVVKDEVQHSLNVVNELHKRWKEIYKSAAGADNEEYSWIESELLSGLRSIEWDLQDLEETIGIVMGNRQKFGLSDEEIASRQEFVETTRANVTSIRGEVNAAQEKQAGKPAPAGKKAAKKAGTERESLLSTDSSGPSELTSVKVDKQAHADNQRFLEDEHMKQQLMMKDQDAQLEDVSKSMGTLKRIGQDINKELVTQGELLDHIDERTESTRTQMQAAMKGLTKLAKDSDKGKLCMILVLSLILLGLFYAVFN
mmetsp:Transcript_8190/g.27806  ORF Transcript_8190/g.27806 Transcript_8190/m.27806 type:complete len:260 (+) Transcript_8190:175-954(+)